MPLRTTDAVVSRTIRMSNSSRIATLISRNFGRVSVMAKGARRPTSRYAAAIEPVTLIRCIYYHKDGREIQSLSSADIIESWMGIKDDVQRFSTAACMLELTQAQTAPEDPTAGLFALLVESLGDLDRAESSNVNKHLWRFMLRFLDAAGYRPTLDRCIRCGKPPKGRSVFISHSEGGVLCSCTDTDRQFGIQVSPGALMAMNNLIQARPEDLGRLKLSRAQCAEVERVALQFIAYHTGSSRAPRSLTFLRKLDAGRQSCMGNTFKGKDDGKESDNTNATT